MAKAKAKAKKSPPRARKSLVGSTAANPHEGSRSEYLAQYVFASFGTAIAVPHQEDTGIDFYCTLTERQGQRLWPRAHYTVQVKSTFDPWIFAGPESVRWLVEHPMPLFLCVIDKATLTVRVYQTMPRFVVWTVPPLPNQLELVPETHNKESDPATWSGGGRFSLGAPIIQKTLIELATPEGQAEFKQLLEFWLKHEDENLGRVRNGVHGLLVPHRYETNSIRQTGWRGGSLTKATPDDMKRSIARAAILVTWLAEQLAAQEDIKGAARAALLLKHLFPYQEGTYDPNYLGTYVMSVQDMLNKHLALKGKNYTFAAIDELSRTVDARLGFASVKSSPSRITHAFKRMARRVVGRHSPRRLFLFRIPSPR